MYCHSIYHMYSYFQNKEHLESFINLYADNLIKFCEVEQEKKEDASAFPIVLYVTKLKTTSFTNMCLDWNILIDSLGEFIENNSENKTTSIKYIDEASKKIMMRELSVRELINYNLSLTGWLTKNKKKKRMRYYFARHIMLDFSYFLCSIIKKDDIVLAQSTLPFILENKKSKKRSYYDAMRFDIKKLAGMIGEKKYETLVKYSKKNDEIAVGILEVSKYRKDESSQKVSYKNPFDLLGLMDRWGVYDKREKAPNEDEIPEIDEVD